MMTVYPSYLKAIEKPADSAVSIWPLQGRISGSWVYTNMTRGKWEGKPSPMADSYYNGFNTRIICNGGEDGDCEPIRRYHWEDYQNGLRYPDFDLIITGMKMFNDGLPLISGNKISFENVDRSKPMRIRSDSKKLFAETYDGKIYSFPKEIAVIYPSKELPENYSIPAITHEICSNLWMFQPYADKRNEIFGAEADKLAAKTGDNRIYARHTVSRIKKIIQKANEAGINELLRTSLELRDIAKSEDKDFFVSISDEQYRTWSDYSKESLPDRFEKALKKKFSHVYEVQWEDNQRGHAIIGGTNEIKWKETDDIGLEVRKL